MQEPTTTLSDGRLFKINGKISVTTFSEMESLGARLFTDSWNEPIKDGGFEVQLKGTEYLTITKGNLCID